MKETFRQSMAWLHTWVGLLLGWLLYFMFVTGTAGYVDTEIDRWMQPELPFAGLHTDVAQTLEAGLQRLSEVAPEASRWFITLGGDRDDPYPSIFWQGDNGRDSELLDPAIAAPPQVRATEGGQLLYQMHWRLHYLPRLVSDWIVVLATMLMLLGLITGIVVHKKIFKDFFTFRPAKGQRSWLDAHNVVSVVTLPFQLMITYSGLIFMMFSVMPLTVAAFYGINAESRQLFTEEAFPATQHREATGEAAPLVSPAKLLENLIALRGKSPIGYVDINHPGDASATIIVGLGEASGPLRSKTLLAFDGVTGELLEDQPANIPPGRLSRDLLLGLHEGLFAGPLLRALYLFSGLLGTAMIATGLVLWTVKRRQRAERTGENPAGLRLVESLNIATIAGLPLAIAAYFWANRLLPVACAARSEWEAHLMFITWGCLFAHAVMRPRGRAWVEQLAGAGLAFALLPLVNALTTDRPLWRSIASRDWVFVGFELSALAIGVVFVLVAVYVHQRDQRVTSAAVQQSRASRAVEARL